jgi:hypothetical protein
MQRTSGRLSVSVGILLATTILYYGEWFEERRAGPPLELPPFEMPTGYWTPLHDEGEGDAVNLVTSFRSLRARGYRYKGMQGEKVGLSFSVLSDIAPVVHCYLWNRYTLVDKGGLKIPTGRMEPKEVEVRTIVVDKEGKKSVCLYWYMGFETVSSNFFIQEACGIARRLVHPGEHFLMVRVVTPVEGNAERRAVEIGSRFLRDVFPFLYDYAGKSTPIRL